MCVICRIYSISLFPCVPDETSYPLSCCSYGFCIPYMPMLFLCAQLPPPFFLVCDLSTLQPEIWFLSIKKRPMFFHSPVYYIIKEAARQAITCRHSPPLLYYRYRFHLVQAGTRFCPRLVFHIIRTYNDAIKQSETFTHPLSPRLQRLSFLPHFHGCLWYPAPPFQAHRFLPHPPPGFR